MPNTVSPKSLVLPIGQCHEVKENYEARYLQKPLARTFLVMLNAVKHLSVPIKY